MNGIYLLSQFRNSRLNSQRYFSTKQKAIDYLDDVILNGYQNSLINSNIRLVENCELVIDWMYHDKWCLSYIELDPTEYPRFNELEEYITFV